ncbi:signal peptidase II [Palleronia abyssalis]|uniref:Lipoprotein signal peptidase n=1 Tax=Palleronia abyssalis TaxID=1501240 RepID=A0A2R8BZU4_9RHOB|nr:signal peptidase II [Palleronia abyssalis]SPJ25653.1 Lipoprotein signal peptidase [Palleronia abyssalis]
MRTCLFAGLLAALIAFLVDQATKAIVVSNATVLSSGVSVFPGFNLIYLRNDGVTFGLLGGAPWRSLVVLALGICVWLAAMLVRTDNRVEAIAYGAIIGGALGNVLDRIRFRGVTDFLDFYVGSTHWPAFNMADVFVVGGVCLLLIAPWLSVKFQTGT